MKTILILLSLMLISQNVHAADFSPPRIASDPSDSWVKALESLKDVEKQIEKNREAGKYVEPIQEEDEVIGIDDLEDGLFYYLDNLPEEPEPAPM